MERFRTQDLRAFVTLDGSEVRELVAYRNSTAKNQSLAEARLRPGQSTRLHLHRTSEEIYYILSGMGKMRIGGQVDSVEPGTAVLIPPGVPHQITNTGTNLLIFLCICAPPYEHEDTVLLDEPVDAQNA